MLKFSVEYNGLYWHSELFNSDLNYHENKTIQCNQSNVNLLHIYEDEWKTKQIIVKSLIKNLLGLTEKFNQKFEIVELSLEESKLFFEDNHLDGNSESDITFGLSHNNEIISAISLNSVEYSNRKYLKIERFTNKLNFDIPNSLNELTKYVLEYSKMNNYNGLLAYVDNRICNNEIIYEKSNYKFLEKTELPQLWLTNFKNRFEISQKQTLEKNESYIWGHRKSIMILDC